MSEMERNDGIANDEVEAERARFENERMTRRAALRKFGFMAGLAAFATVSVDDLARVASKKLQENEMTKGIGDTLAKEFRMAGVALANPYGGDPPPNPYNPYHPYPPQDCGEDCLFKHEDCNRNCGPAPWGCLPEGGSAWPHCFWYNGCLLSCGTYRRYCDIECASQE